MNLNISWKEDVTYSKVAGLSYSCEARKKGRTDEKDSKLGWIKVRRDGYASKSYQSLSDRGSSEKRKLFIRQLIRYPHFHYRWLKVS